jgi:protein-L-isoaspartate(D-aspartate) O-methyltransferase
MRTVPRHEFMPADVRESAYADSALPVGFGQTISQPYIVGLMTELLGVKPGDKVLEAGTGSGYQAAVLAEMGATVYTVEIVEPLAVSSRTALAQAGYGEHVTVRHGDSFEGWEEAAPFDAVIVTCAVSQIPPRLMEQLKTGGRLVAPVGAELTYQTLTLAVKNAGDRFTYKDVTGVVFVPMTGPHGFA